MSQASVWMTWTAASELWPQQALIRASSSTGTAASAHIGGVTASIATTEGLSEPRPQPLAPAAAVASSAATTAATGLVV